MQKARRHLERLRPLVSVWFQDLFTPLLGVLFTFPSRYSFTIGLSVVFSLTRWCWYIQTGFHRPRPTQFINISISTTGLSPSLVILSRIFVYVYKNLMGSSAFARHYSRNLYWSPFLGVLRCFSSPRLRYYVISSIWQVSLFGHLRINNRLHLPVAFRSLPRPSSPLRA